MGVQQAVFVREQPIGEHGIAQVHKIQEIQVQPLRDTAADQATQKRGQRDACHGDKQPDPPVKCPVQLHQRANGFRIVLRDRFVHAEHHGAVYTQFCQIQERQNGTKQTVQAKILNPQSMQHHGTQNKRKHHIQQLQNSAGYQVPYSVFRSLNLQNSCSLSAVHGG